MSLMQGVKELIKDVEETEKVNTLITFNSLCYEWKFKKGLCPDFNENEILQDVALKGHTTLTNSIIRIRKGHMRDLDPKMVPINMDGEKVEKDSVFFYDECDSEIGGKPFYLIDFFIDHKNRNNRNCCIHRYQCGKAELCDNCEIIKTHFDDDAACFGVTLKRRFLVLREDTFSDAMKEHYKQKGYLSHTFEFITFWKDGKPVEDYDRYKDFIIYLDNTNIKLADKDAYEVLDGTYHIADNESNKGSNKNASKETAFLSWIATYLLNVVYMEQIRDFGKTVDEELSGINPTTVTHVIGEDRDSENGETEAKNHDISIGNNADKARTINNKMSRLIANYNLYLSKYYREYPVNLATAKKSGMIHDRAHDYFRVEKYRQELNEQMINLHAITEVIRKHAELEAKKMEEAKDQKFQRRNTIMMAILTIIGLGFTIVEFLR